MCNNFFLVKLCIYISNLDLVVMKDKVDLVVRCRIEKIGFVLISLLNIIDVWF